MNTEAILHEEAWKIICDLERKKENEMKNYIVHNISATALSVGTVGSLFLMPIGITLLVAGAYCFNEARKDSLQEALPQFYRLKELKQIVNDANILAKIDKILEVEPAPKIYRDVYPEDYPREHSILD